MVHTFDLLAGARAHPDRVAIYDGSGALSYTDLQERARVLAARVQRAAAYSRGELSGELSGERSAELSGEFDLAEAPIAMLVTPGAEWVIALWAVWLAGGIAVPLSPQHPAAEWEYVLNDSGARCVLVDARHATLVHSLATARGVVVVPTVGDASNAPVSVTPPAAPPSHAARASERRALMLYTSGTTGQPKGVVHTHGSLGAQVASLVTAWEWAATDHTLLVLPLHHVHGVVNVVCCALAVGASVTVHERFEASAVWHVIRADTLTVLHAVPTIWRRLLDWLDSAGAVDRERSVAAVAAMRLLVSGSAALPVSLLNRWREISGHVLLERYGMTEIGMALSNPLHGPREPGHVGNALPGVELRAVNEHGVPVAAGEPGSLEVRGATVMREYWRRPAETTAAFRDGWFRTGDVAVHEQTTSGPSWRLLGRESTDIIKTGGYKVSALEIEEVVRLHAAVRECAVVGLPDAEWGECVAVAVELAEPPVTPILTLRALRAFAKTRLAVYKVPTRLQVVAALPRNAMGKVVKADVRACFS